MSTKIKRTVYLEADCHRLVDIIINSFRNKVENKKTDALTWKQKNAVWDKITELYNSGTTKHKTSEQLRCKYDNLKKEVRKYESQKRQNLYKTGGGSDDSNIKAVIKLLYEKIKSIITLSADGLEPSPGDSDIILKGNRLNIPKENNLDVSSEIGVNEIIEYENSSGPAESGEVMPSNCSMLNQEVDNDWSDYTPKMLKNKKHKALQVKKKKLSLDDECYEKENHVKIKMFNLKKKLLEEEAERERELHEMRLKKEEELYNKRIEKQELENKKITLEVKLLHNQLENYN